MSNVSELELCRLNTIIKQKKRKLVQAQEKHDYAVENWYYAAVSYCPVKIGDTIRFGKDSVQDAVLIGLEPDDKTGMPVLRLRKINSKNELFTQVIKMPLWEWLETGGRV